SSLASGGASSLLSDLPSRGLFSSTVLSSSLGGMRVYVCDHDTSPPEEQVIKTNTTNILIRALQINKQKTDLKEATKPNKGKRSAGRALEERTPAKKANTASSSSGARHEGSSATEFTEKKLQSMTVERLRLQLRERGLSPKGKKDELISRLRDAS
ncbi:uncharacterized protein LOC109838569, partial [Asparagus officinalis]|uniref:uncharacterized protein LOC109838569 n=1 Tax=Asparagus officinalis TaxID=4686 RepID=UPI00098DEFC7